MEEVRRKEARRDAAAREHLEKTCWLWRKNPEGWTERESGRWDELKDKPLVTSLASRCLVAIVAILRLKEMPDGTMSTIHTTYLFS